MSDACKHLENVFIDYINGNASSNDTDFCIKHLKECPECKNNEIYIDYIFTWDSLDKLNDITPSKNFMPKLLHNIALIEEKNKLFWYRLDYIFAIFRVPMMTAFLLIFISINNQSYANSQKVILKTKNEYLEKKVMEIKEMKTSDFLLKIQQLANEIKGEKK